MIRVTAKYMGLDRPPYKRLNATGYLVRHGSSILCDIVMSKVTKRDSSGGTLFHKCRLQWTAKSKLAQFKSEGASYNVG